MEIRPIRPEDEPAMVRFHRTLSDASIHSRYFGALKLDARIAHERLARICTADGERVVALIAVHGGEILAVARLVRLPDDSAEFALLVTDAAQGHGLGHSLLERLLDAARAWGVQRVVAEILPENGAMRRVCASLGFSFHGATGASCDVQSIKARRCAATLRPSAPSS